METTMLIDPGADTSASVKRVQGWCAKHPDAVILVVGSASVGTVLFLGGSLATTAGLLAVLSSASMLILLTKLPDDLSRLPEWIPDTIRGFQWKKWLIRHQVLVDILVSVGAVAAMGTTVTGLLASAIIGLCTSMALVIATKIWS